MATLHLRIQLAIACIGGKSNVEAVLQKAYNNLLLDLFINFSSFSRSNTDMLRGSTALGLAIVDYWKLLFQISTLYFSSKH